MSWERLRLNGKLGWTPRSLFLGWSSVPLMRLPLVRGTWHLIHESSVGWIKLRGVLCPIPGSIWYARKPRDDWVKCQWSWRIHSENLASLTSLRPWLIPMDMDLNRGLKFGGRRNRAMRTSPVRAADQDGKTFYLPLGPAPSFVFSQGLVPSPFRALRLGQKCPGQVETEGWGFWQQKVQAEWVGIV